MFTAFYFISVMWPTSWFRPQTIFCCFCFVCSMLFLSIKLIINCFIFLYFLDGARSIIKHTRGNGNAIFDRILIVEFFIVVYWKSQYVYPNAETFDRIFPLHTCAHQSTGGLSQRSLFAWIFLFCCYCWL